MAKKSSKAAKNSAAPGGAEPKPKAAASKPIASSFSNELIGQSAGQIWTVLSENGGLTIAALKKFVDAPNDLVLAGLGWLAREDKLTFVAAGRTLKVSLR